MTGFKGLKSYHSERKDPFFHLLNNTYNAYNAYNAYKEASYTDDKAKQPQIR